MNFTTGLYGERLLLPGGKAGGGKKLVLHGEDRGSDRRFSPPVLSVHRAVPEEF